MEPVQPGIVITLDSVSRIPETATRMSIVGISISAPIMCVEGVRHSVSQMVIAVVVVLLSLESVFTSEMVVPSVGSGKDDQG